MVANHLGPMGGRQGWGQVLFLTLTRHRCWKLTVTGNGKERTTPALCQAQGPLPTMEMRGCAGPRGVQCLPLQHGASQAYFLGAG